MERDVGGADIVGSSIGVGLTTQTAATETGSCRNSRRARRAAVSKGLNTSLVLSDVTLMNPANACFLAMVGRSLNPLHPLREATKLIDSLEGLGRLARLLA